MLDAEKHVREKERLNQALNGKLTQAVDDIKDALRRNNIEHSAGIAVDVCIYAIEELHLERLNLSRSRTVMAGTCMRGSLRSECHFTASVLKSLISAMIARKCFQESAFMTFLHCGHVGAESAVLF